MNFEKPHARETADVLRALDTDRERGLSDAEAAARLRSHGPNALPEPKRPSVIASFLKQFHSALMYILLAALALSFALGETQDGIGIGIAVAMNVIIGFALERRAEAAIERLRSMVAPEALVIREGHTHRVPAATVVPGDILALEEGARIPADARVIVAREMEADESALTGESSAVVKNADAVPADAVLADMSNMAWMGTTLTRGTGRAVVVETGMRTAFGKIASSLHVIKRDRTPLELRLDVLGRQLGLAAIAVSLIAFAGGVLRGTPPASMAIFTVAMIVSVVPEGLLEVLAVVLAIGVLRMARRNAIIRHVPSVETLGAADVICTDKTGTLTENKMTVREIALLESRVTVSGEGWEPKGGFSVAGAGVRPSAVPGLERLLESAVLVSGARLELTKERYGIVGDATDGALTVAAAKAGITKEDASGSVTVLGEVPFSSLRKYHAVLVEHRAANGVRRMMLHAVGAFGTLRDRSDAVSRNGIETAFSAEDRERCKAMNADMASRALRVIAVASKAMPDDAKTISDDDVQGLEFLGLAAMSDPPRAGVAAAVARCRRAGIRVIMLTGDQKETAMAVGREIGLLRDAGDEVFTERETVAMSDDALRRALAHAAVFARVSPQTKLRIVDGLQRMGHVVAMTGDGVNDAPALKKASIGIAMGITGTDVTKEVADMVLADDDFVSIVNAVEEGRIVFRNVRQTTAYLFMTNLGEAVTILAAILLGLPMPLLAAQILWMNVVTDGLPDVALAAEPAIGDMLDGPPRRKDEPILSRSLLALSAFTALLMCAGTLGLFLWDLQRADIAHARTIAFTVMAAFQLWNVFCMRSDTASVFSLGFFSNRFVVAAVGISLLLQAMVVYVPWLQQVFSTVPLGFADWVRIALVSMSVFIFVELWKLLQRGKMQQVG